MDFFSCSEKQNAARFHLFLLIFKSKDSLNQVHFHGMNYFLQISPIIKAYSQENFPQIRLMQHKRCDLFLKKGRWLSLEIHWRKKLNSENKLYSSTILLVMNTNINFLLASMRFKNKTKQNNSLTNHSRIR